MRRNRKCTAIFTAAIMITLAATACRNNSNFVDISDLQQYKTDYVGDNSNVVSIVSQPDYPKGYSYEHIEIQSETEPYSLKVYLKVEENVSNIEELLQINADTAFDLIGNLEILEYINEDTKEVIASYEAS